MTKSAGAKRKQNFQLEQIAMQNEMLARLEGKVEDALAQGLSNGRDIKNLMAQVLEMRRDLVGPNGRLDRLERTIEELRPPRQEESRPNGKGGA